MRTHGMSPRSNCKGQLRDILDYYGMWEKNKILYGGLVELIVNAMVDAKPGFIEWEWHQEAAVAKRILVVDDEQDVRNFISALLTDTGYEVITAENGNQAMDAVKASAPDLVSLDISMPEKSGLKFYREMKTDDATRGIPILIVTGIQNLWAAPDGTGSFEHFISSRKQVPPPEGYFEKPVKPAEFLAKVAGLIE